MIGARGPKLAVLIDADNAPARYADALFEEIARLGEASLRRAYGDFSRAPAGWRAEVLANHAIQTHHQFPHTARKNATDIAMVIDAMDLMHSGRFDGFCLVSSDSDFTRLAARIREQGFDVVGIGEQKTPESFRRACSRFIYLENLTPEAAPDAASAPPRRPPSQAIQTLESAIREIEGDDQGWMHLGEVGNILRNLAPDFDARTYGYAKLSELVTATGCFEINRKNKVVYLREKPRPWKPTAGG